LAVPLFQSDLNTFKNWALEKNKPYQENDEEFHLRYTLWQDAIHFINQENAKNLSYTLGPTFFADLTEEEKISLIRSYNPSSHEKFQSRTSKLSHQTNVPDNLDWRNRRAVTVIKNQFECGSSPLFAVIGTIEATHVVYEGYPLTNLSTQQLLDCCPAEQAECSGCNGNNFDSVYLYAMANGVMRESDYPYTGMDGVCKYDRSKTVAGISNFKIINSGDEDEAVRVLAENSPIATALDATPSTFVYYTGGVYSDNQCDHKLISHGMLLMGYGFDTDSNMKFFTLKNTWGTDWGEKGYMRIIRDGSNRCGVVEYCNYPIY